MTGDSLRVLTDARRFSLLSLLFFCHHMGLFLAGGYWNCVRIRELFVFVVNRFCVQKNFLEILQLPHFCTLTFQYVVFYYLGLLHFLSSSLLISFLAAVKKFLGLEKVSMPSSFSPSPSPFTFLFLRVLYDRRVLPCLDYGWMSNTAAQVEWPWCPQGAGVQKQLH